MSTAHDTPATEPVNGDGELYGVLAEFDTPGELVEAARRVRDAGYTEFDCYSPFPVHGIDPAMGIKRTILPAIIFGGGMTGALGGLLLQWYTNAHAWTWNISGKPLWSIPANIPVAYELAILVSAITPNSLPSRRSGAIKTGSGSWVCGSLMASASSPRGPRASRP